MLERPLTLPIPSAATKAFLLLSILSTTSTSGETRPFSPRTSPSQLAFRAIVPVNHSVIPKSAPSGQDAFFIKIKEAGNPGYIQLKIPNEERVEKGETLVIETHFRTDTQDSGPIDVALQQYGGGPMTVASSLVPVTKRWEHHRIVFPLKRSYEAGKLDLVFNLAGTAPRAIMVSSIVTTVYAAGSAPPSPLPPFASVGAPPPSDYPPVDFHFFGAEYGRCSGTDIGSNGHPRALKIEVGDDCPSHGSIGIRVATGEGGQHPPTARKLTFSARSKSGSKLFVALHPQTSGSPPPPLTLDVLGGNQWKELHVDLPSGRSGEEGGFITIGAGTPGASVEIGRFSFQ